MAKSIIGKIGKLFAVAVAVAMLAGCVFAFSACESKNPEISVTVSFNGEEYTLEYKLYRSFAPQTVAHYIELIDLDYFDNTVIHDFQSDRMVGGGFTYENMENGDVMDDLVQLDYDAATTNTDGSLKLNHISVWKDSARTQATNRLYGEFSSNGFRIENGGLSNSFGALGTYTYARKDAGDASESMSAKVYTRQSNGSEGESAYYKNSFQGMFYIYMGTSSATESNYCIFGELKNDASKTALENLQSAINAYRPAGVGEDEEYSFTEELSKEIKDSMIEGGTYDPANDFLVPQSKIVITEVRVTKY